MTELEAMAKIDQLMRSLSSEERSRVISWLTHKYGSHSSVTRISDSDLANDPNGKRFSTFAEAFDTFNPQNLAERALIGLWWVDQASDDANHPSQPINNELKNAGYPIKNITDALSASMSQQPKYVLQTRKSGSSKQARKLYRLTDAGRKFIQERLDSGYVRDN